MVRQEWEQAIARAVVERSFRARLLADPADTLADYGVGASETPALEQLRSHTLEQLTSSLLRLSRDEPWSRLASCLDG